jgi:hypothetical protein
MSFCNIEKVSVVVVVKVVVVRGSLVQFEPQFR